MAEKEKLVTSTIRHNDDNILLAKRKTRERTELKDYLAKVVGMSGEVEETRVAYGLTHRMASMEPKLLGVADCLYDQPDGVQDDPGDVAARSKGPLREACDGWRVEDGHGQGDGPDPDHLEEPAAEEGDQRDIMVAAMVVMAVMAVLLANPEDTKEEKTRQAGCPDDEKRRGNDLASIPRPVEGQGDDGKDNKVGAPCEICMDGVSRR